jgi:hypothetical protein
VRTSAEVAVSQRLHVEISRPRPHGRLNRSLDIAPMALVIARMRPMLPKVRPILFACLRAFDSRRGSGYSMGLSARADVGLAGPSEVPFEVGGAPLFYQQAPSGRVRQQHGAVPLF